MNTNISLIKSEIASAQPLDARSRDLRRIIVKMIEYSRRGHIGSAFSLIEIIRVLYDDILKYDSRDPGWKDRDRFILSKGHASALMYCVLARAGYFPEKKLQDYRKIGSELFLSGHPHPKTPGVEIASGSLGQGLSVGHGVALGARVDKLNYKVYVVLGDGEIQEGQIWEAAMSAATFNSNNLIAIVDNNKVAQDNITKDLKDLEPLEDKWSTWNADTTAYYNHLDENDYLFKVKSRYEEGSEQETPDSVTFTINNIAGPGLRFFPLYREVENFDAFTMDIYAEEVTGLIGAEISCFYDTGLVMLDTTAISAGSFLSAASGYPIIIEEYDVVTGSLILTVATLEDGTDLGGETSLSGSGSLVQLPFTAISAGTFVLSFSNTSVYVQENAPETTVLYTSLTSATIVIE